MIKSMTGYGRYQQVVDGRDITVEIKSVNHRYFEFSARVPRAYGYLEDKLKSLVHTGISRGKTDVYVGMAAAGETGLEVQINKPLAGAYLDALRELSREYNIDDDINTTKLARLPDVLTVQRAAEDEDAVWLAVKSVAEVALFSMVSMRGAEGEQLSADILSRLSMLEQYTGVVEERSPIVAAEHRERLYARLSEILENRQIDESRILTEAAIFAEKTAVAEETVRLRSHIAQLRGFISQDEPTGRKLDFLIQELNREVNTIGSKSQDIELARVVVEMKSEIEKIREQVQNIE